MALDCEKCKRTVAVGNFLLQQTFCDPPQKRALCAECVSLLEEEGFEVKVFESPPVPSKSA